MLERDLAGKPGPTFPDHAQNLGIRGRSGAQKGSPAKRTGHTLLVAAQYSQKSPQNNGLFGRRATICWGEVIAIGQVLPDIAAHRRPVRMQMS
jgi:hypothetical protein